MSSLSRQVLAVRTACEKYTDFVHPPLQLPQRFQGVNFTTAERAGILLLPATVVTPVGAMITGWAAKKVPVEVILICSAAAVCIGMGLLSSLPTQSHLWPGLYGYEVITGLALGLANPSYLMLVATSIPEKGTITRCTNCIDKH
jgi:MFS family permease